MRGAGFNYKCLAVRFPGGGPDFPYGSVGDGGGPAPPADAAVLPPRPPLPRPEDYYAPPPPPPGHPNPRTPASPESQEQLASSKHQGPVYVFVLSHYLT